MKRIYQNLEAKKFRIISSVVLILCDLMIFFYLYKKFADKSMFDRILSLSFKINPQLNASDFTPALSSQLYELMTNFLLSALCVAFIYHLFVYFMWIKEKKFAAHYIALYVWIAAPATFLSGILGLKDNFQQSLIFLFWSALFFFVALGLGQFPIRHKKISAK